MVTHAHTNVSAAFDILLEAMEEEIAAVTRALTDAADRGEYALVRELAGFAEEKARMRERVMALRVEWHGTSVASPQSNGQPLGTPRRNLGRLPPGLRTRTEDYFLPILETLEEMGGRARASEVLERIRERMDAELSPVDLDAVPSDPRTPRWRKSAQWARYHMVREGLVKSDSPRGIWEISEQGREYLRRACEREQEQGQGA